jgi:hypothetical protein
MIDGYCLYKDRECSAYDGSPLVERSMDTFSVENCKEFCSATPDCMSFEAKL